VKTKSGRHYDDRFSEILKLPSGSATAALSTTLAAPIAAVPAATATRRPRFARARFINCERPTFERFAVNFRNCLLRVCVGAHRNKGEAARFAGKFVLHQHDFLHRASLRKKLLQFVFGGVKWEISHV
jgi:hypothetical protein